MYIVIEKNVLALIKYTLKYFEYQGEIQFKWFRKKHPYTYIYPYVYIT